MDTGDNARGSDRALDEIDEELGSLLVDWEPAYSLAAIVIPVVIIGTALLIHL